MEKETVFSFGQYCIGLKSESNGCVSFQEVTVHDRKTQTTLKSNGPDFAPCQKSKLVVIDSCLLALKQDNYPRFAIIVNDKLTEIPSFTAEQILRAGKISLSTERLDSLNRFQPGAKWQDHNGIIINPETLAVPGMLDYLLWIKKRNIRIPVPRFKSFDLNLLSIILTRKTDSKQSISYISSDNLFDI